MKSLINNPGTGPSLLLTLFEKACLILACLTLIMISLYILFYRGLNFDGAMNAQSAFNFIHHGSILMDYLPNQVQTKLPFQAVNGALLCLFGRNFVAANLANVLFYVLFFLFVVRLSKISNSVLPLLAFIAFSFSPAFHEFGFGGLGELPALFYGLLGAYFLIIHRTNLCWLALGGIIAATAVATKWVLVLILLPLLVVVYLFLLNRELKTVLVFGFFFALTLCSLWLFEYSFYLSSFGEFGQVLTKVLSHSTPSNRQFYDNYTERLIMFWNEYLLHSGSPSVAVVKVFISLALVITVCWCVFEQTLARLSKTAPKNTLDNVQIFALFLAAFAVVYALWWGFLSGKPWYRRALNADLLIFIAASTLPLLLAKIPKPGFCMLSRVVLVVVFIALGIQHSTQFATANKNGLLNKSETIITTEHRFRKALDQLPQDYVPYGYAWYQAPRWSFLSGRKFRNILNHPPLDCLTKSGNCYLFFEDVNSLWRKGISKMHQEFLLEPVFSLGGFKIKKILGFAYPNADRRKSFVDLSAKDYPLTKGWYERELGSFCWAQPLSEVLLSYHQEKYLYLELVFRDPASYTTDNLALELVMDSTRLALLPVNKKGDFKKKIPIPSSLQESKTSESTFLRLKLNGEFICRTDKRRLAYMVKKIGFVEDNVEKTK